MAEPEEHVPRQQPVDQVAVADEVDLLDTRRAVGHAGAREQRIHPTTAGVDSGVDGGLLDQVDVYRLDAGQGDVGDVHDHDLGAGVPSQLRRGGTHPRGPADHQDPLAVVAECIEDRHLSPPDPSRPGDDAADLQVDDGVPVESESARIPSPCSLNSGAREGTAGSSSNWTGAATNRKAVPDAVWHSCTYPLATVCGSATASSVSCTIAHWPVNEASRSRHRLERFAEAKTSVKDRDRGPAVLNSDGVVGEPWIRRQFRAADGLAQGRPSTCRPGGR